MAKKDRASDGSGDVANSRFASIQSDPRFKLPRRKQIKGDLDSRFKSALSNDQRFTKKAAIDKYGRKVRSKDAKQELSRYYNFDDEENDKRAGSDSDAESEVESVPESSESETESSGSESEVPTAKGKPKVTKRQLMRGEGASDLSSDDESSDESDSDVEKALQSQIDEYEQVRGSKEDVPHGDETKRLAVVNMDWDNITSTDLMAAFSSFVPPNRRILSIRIFPSEYGKKRMQEEEVAGPAQELFDSNDVRQREKQSKGEDMDGDQDYSSTRLRKYQLQRLQYYYAVVECDSTPTAAAIYDKCDGSEYESTANFFDLRYIPDGVEFTDRPRDECNRLPASYQPTNFTTDALQHSKVKLTWDETPKERARMTQKAFSLADAEDLDLKAYLASESEGSEDEGDIAAKYRALLGQGASHKASGADGGSDDEAVEITFNPVLEGKEATLEVVPDAAAGDADDNITSIEKYKQKEKERRQRRMERYRARKAAEQEQESGAAQSNDAELELLAMDDDLAVPNPATADTKGKKGRKMTKTAAKKKAQQEAEQDFDTQDPRFQALFEDPDFAIDSTLPQFKKTKGMEEIIQERRRRQERDAPQDVQRPRKRPPTEIDTAQLVSKLRRKHAK